MHTPTAPRRPMAKARGAGRFGGTLTMQRPTPRVPSITRHRSKGIRGMLQRATRGLPIVGGKSRKRRGRGSSSKARPMVGLMMAGAGAMLGRQMKRRREQDRMDQPTPAL